MQIPPPDTAEAPAARDVRRRTVIAGAAWSVPAIAVAAATPAYAASGTALTITRVPGETLSCHATTGPLVAHLQSSNAVGQVVQFSLPSGWRWANGSGSYVTDSSGNATVPAGDIVAGVRVGSISATNSGVTTAADVQVAGTGTLATGSNSVAFPSNANSQILRVNTNLSGAVVTKTTGDIWSWFDNGTSNDEAWTQIGTGASTNAQAATYVWAPNTKAALWVKSGALQLGTSAVTFSSGGNSDFSRVASCGPLAMALKTNGDVWGWQEGGSWTQLDTGVTDDLDQIAPVHDSTAGNTFYWVKNGVVTSSSGSVAIGSGENTSVVRLTQSWTNGGGQTGLSAVRANGDVWTWSQRAGWMKVATGASTGPEQTHPQAGANGNPTVTIAAGQIQVNGRPAQMGQGESNDNFIRDAVANDRVLAVKRDGSLYDNYGGRGANQYVKIASNVSTGYSEIGITASSSGSLRYRLFWITPASC
ncbi:hypothetical protein [Microbacterium testaceum]|uniref:hypothetical protein n=1 Tax=Microbacterium testaceum TaxID=2033 RepID=UPI00381D98CC